MSGEPGPARRLTRAAEGAGPDDYTRRYFQEVREIAAALDLSAIDSMLTRLAAIREGGGRLFFLGNGGGAAHADHAVGDFRKITGMECYAPSEGVAELTARVNDEGWESCYAEWLRGSRLGARDGVFVFSVGGGNAELGISVNLVAALRMAREAGATILAVAGRDGGFAAQVADVCLVIPMASADTITPHTEEFQAVVWHLLVSHPRMRRSEMKWESAGPRSSSTGTGC